jgi:hypothetical protein
MNKLGAAAFSGCAALETVVLPSGLTGLNAEVFANCVNLSRIELPAALRTIGDWAFYGCESLTSLDIPSGVWSIGDWAFARYDEARRVYAALPALTLTVKQDSAAENYCLSNGISYTVK